MIIIILQFTLFKTTINRLMASVLKSNFLATATFIMPILYVVLPVNPDIKEYVVSTLEVIAEVCTL